MFKTAQYVHKKQNNIIRPFYTPTRSAVYSCWRTSKYLSTSIRYQNDFSYIIMTVDTVLDFINFLHL